MPDLSGVMSYAFQPCVIAPPSAFDPLVACRKLRSVWHSPQCPSASTRYLPRFHSGDLLESDFMRSFESNSQLQYAISQRWSYGKFIALAGVALCTGFKLKRYALMASASSSESL